MGLIPYSEKWLNYVASYSSDGQNRRQHVITDSDALDETAKGDNVCGMRVPRDDNM
jgi:hypothetical protein